jgi:hypothetical protein
MVRKTYTHTASILHTGLHVTGSVIHENQTMRLLLSGGIDFQLSSVLHLLQQQTSFGHFLDQGAIVGHSVPKRFIPL